MLAQFKKHNNMQVKCNMLLCSRACPLCPHQSISFFLGLARVHFTSWLFLMTDPPHEPILHSGITPVYLIPGHSGIFKTSTSPLTTHQTSWPHSLSQLRFTLVFLGCFPAEHPAEASPCWQHHSNPLWHLLFTITKTSLDSTPLSSPCAAVSSADHRSSLFPALL